MRTTIDIPVDLLEEARRGAGLRTKRETVISALQELVQRNELEALHREKQMPKLSRLKKREDFCGNPDEIIGMDWSKEWREPKREGGSR